MALEALLSIRDAATRFSEYDRDGDRALDLEEFLAMQPRKVRDTYSTDEIAVWFDEVANGKDRVTINDFFRWTLVSSTEVYGERSLRAAFKRWDRDKSGYLDSAEFDAAATELGFGTVAHELFVALDTNNSGAIRYEELADVLRKDAETTSRAAKEMLSTMIMTGAAVESEGTRQQCATGLDCSKWVFRAKTPATFREELQRLLRESGAHIVDIIKLFDVRSHVTP